jgi:hypothetical protein
MAGTTLGKDHEACDLMTHCELPVHATSPPGRTSWDARAAAAAGEDGVARA